MAHDSEVVAAYIIHRNAPEWCASAARSLLGSEGVRVELTVIDNGQEHGPPLEALLPSGVRLLRVAQNVGYAGGANIAIEDWRNRLPDSEFCIIGSHDLHLRVDAIRKLVDAAAVERYGVLAPALISPYQFAGGYWTGWREGPVPLAGVQGLAERDWVPGSCMLLRRECVESIGGFDETFGSYVEDVDYCLRARDAGWKVGVVAQALHWGLGSASRSAGPMMIANRVRLVAKRRGRLIGLLRGITTMSFLGFRTLTSLMASLVFRMGTEGQSESTETVFAYRTALRRTGTFLKGMWGQGGLTQPGSQEAYREVSVPGESSREGVGGRDPARSRGPVTSIVITTRDRPASATRALASALRQTIRNIEVVVVNTGSETSFQPPHDERVRVIRMDGLPAEPAARNRGLNEAKGQWITFLGEDDEMVPHMVETSLRAATESRLPPPVAALSAIEVADPTGHIVEVRIPETRLQGELAPRHNVGGDFRPIHTLFAPVQVLRAIGGWDEEISAWVHDDLFLRLSAVCSIQGIQQITYRMNADERVVKNHMARAEGIALTLAKHRELFRGRRQAHAHLLAEMGKSYLKAGAWLPAVAASTRALVGDPQRPYAIRQWLGSLAGPHAWSWYVRMREHSAARS